MLTLTALVPLSAALEIGFDLSPSRGFFDEERRSSSESESRDLMNSSLTRVSCSPSS